MSAHFTPVYSKEVEEALAEEFKDILQDRIYLDHAGATLYSQTQIAAVHSELSKNLFANPHSKSTVSKTTEDRIDAVRYQILDFFNASPQEYSVIFTCGATGAIKLVAETFDYQNGRLVYLEENHTSVLGMRAYAPKHSSLSTAQVSECFEQHLTKQNGFHGDHLFEVNVDATTTNNLFVYPAQCNFSGRKYPLDWIRQTQDGALCNSDAHKAGTCNKWYCLLDAASFAGTNPLDLTNVHPDFVAVSFYKLFGYPTGLGALLVRTNAAGVLKKRYFGGGTVFMALASRDVVVHRTNVHEKFEDGTISFLSIAALKHGFSALQRRNLSMRMVQSHVFNLAQYVYHALAAMQHYNTERVCVLYHDDAFTAKVSQGGIVNFNIVRANGTYVGFAEVMHIANLFNISLRTGCFCNPGACQRHLGITSETVQYYFEMGHVCGDQRDLIDGKPTGSVRISFGYMSTKRDADALLDMIRSCFIQRAMQPNIHNGLVSPLEALDLQGAEVGTLEKIYIYPIKSCAAVEVAHAWKLVSTGLQYDREWMVVNHAGVCLTQKHDTRMCLIQPRIDLDAKQLILTYDANNNMAECVAVDLDVDATFDSRCHSKVCGDKIQGWDCGDEVAAWLDSVLLRDGLRLIRQFDRNVRSAKREEVKLSLVNQAQFLLINKASVEWLYERVPEVVDNDGDIQSKEVLDASIARFRPNLLIDFPRAFVENSFTELYIGSVKFTVQGQCTRCQMICIDQATGKKTVEPLRTLSRALHGKICFGIYLQMAPRAAPEQGGCVLAPAMTTAGITAAR